jgi:hypothetical protein
VFLSVPVPFGRDDRPWPSIGRLADGRRDAGPGTAPPRCRPGVGDVVRDRRSGGELAAAGAVITALIEGISATWIEDVGSAPLAPALGGPCS